MTTKAIQKLQTPIGEVIKRVDRSGLIIESRAGKKFAIVPLDDDVLDLLLERSPKLIRECQRARDEMAKGHYSTLEEVKARLGIVTGRKGVSQVRRSTRRKSRK